MQDKSNISIFQGSTVEADTVHDFLAQQGIASLIRNHMQENLDAGWVTADPEHAAEVFVAVEDEKKAVDLLRNLFSQDTAVPQASTSGGSATIITEGAANTDRAEARRPLNLPKMISVPTAENRPSAGNTQSPGASKPATATSETRPTPPPAAPKP